MSQYVTISGADLDYFKSIVSQGLSGSFGELTELRVVFNGGAMCIGANGHSSEWFGQAEQGPNSENGSTPSESSEPEQIGDIMRRLGILESIAANAEQRLGVSLK